MNIQEMEAGADRAVELLKALGNRSRLLLLCQMKNGERSVGDLAQAMNLRDAAVSQQLALLRKDGLVTTRRQGQTVYYALASKEAAQVIDTLFTLFCPAPDQ